MVQDQNLSAVCLREVQGSLDQSVKRLLEIRIREHNVEDYFEITTQFENFHKLQSEVSKIFGDPIEANIQYRPISQNEVPEGKVESIQKFIDALEDLDDVQNVWAGI